MKYNKTIEFDPADKPEIYSIRIANLLNEQGLTQEDLAKMSGVSKSSITAWIFGDKTGKRTEPKILGLNCVAKALGVSVDYLIGNSPNPTTNEELQGVCKYTGLSEKAITLFKDLKEEDADCELSLFFEDAIGKEFLYAIIRFAECVKSVAKHRGFMAATSDEPFIFESLEDTRLTLVESYEIIAFRITRILQRYFEKKADEIIQPVFEYEAQKNDELIKSEKEFDEWLKKVTKDDEL